MLIFFSLIVTFFNSRISVSISFMSLFVKIKMLCIFPLNLLSKLVNFIQIPKYDFKSFLVKPLILFLWSQFLWIDFLG